MKEKFSYEKENPSAEDANKQFYEEVSVLVSKISHSMEGYPLNLSISVIFHLVMSILAQLDESHRNSFAEDINIMVKKLGNLKFSNSEEFGKFIDGLEQT